MTTFHELVRAYLDQSKPKASYAVYRRLSHQYFLTWPEWPTYQTIEDWHATLRATPHHANKGLAFLKALFTWAIRRGYYQGVNPASGIKRHRVVSRDRVMTSTEISVLLTCMDMMTPKLAALLTVLLTTGCRLSEALTAERAHIDLATGRWYQPKTKSGRSHYTYLAMQTRRALAVLPADGPYLFGGYYAHHWSRGGAEKSWRMMRDSLGLADVRLHDFRRTLATHLHDHENNAYLVKAALNHANPEVTAIYVRTSYDRIAKALQAQADRFFALAQEVRHEDRMVYRTTTPLPLELRL